MKRHNMLNALNSQKLIYECKIAKLIEYNRYKTLLADEEKEIAQHIRGLERVIATIEKEIEGYKRANK